MKEPRFGIFLALFALVFACPAFAQDEKTTEQQEEKTEEKQEEKEPTSMDVLDSLNKELMETSMKFRKEMMEAQSGDDDEAMAKVQAAMSEASAPIFTKALAIADLGTEDEEASLRAIGWLLSRANDGEIHKKVGEALVTHHRNNPKAAEALGQLSMPTQAGQDLFDLLISKSENNDVKGQASFAKLGYIGQAIQMAPMIKGNPQIAKMYPKVADYMTSLEDMDEEALMTQMQKVAEEFGDVEVKGKKISKLVANQVKAIEIRNAVKVGKVAPEIEGPDIDGTNFKLSDYRGKVVMLDFWGDW